MNVTAPSAYQQSILQNLRRTHKPNRDTPAKVNFREGVDNRLLPLPYLSDRACRAADSSKRRKPRKWPVPVMTLGVHQGLDAMHP